jgi:hypothetical protein
MEIRGDRLSATLHWRKSGRVRRETGEGRRCDSFTVKAPPVIRLTMLLFTVRSAFALAAAGPLQ